MKAALRWTLFAALALALLVATTLLLVVWALPHDMVSVYVNGQPVEIPPLTPLQWVAVTAAVMFAFTVVLIVVPVAVAVGVGVPLLLAALVVALLASPVLLVAWLVWKLWKRAGSRPTMPG